MSFTVKFTAKYQDGTDVVEQTKELTADSKNRLDLQIADSTTDQEVAFTCDFSQLEGILITSDKAITIETNASDHAGGQEIAIAAGVPFLWLKSSGITCPITADVTKLFITNASGTAANVKIAKLEDPTV